MSKKKEVQILVNFYWPYEETDPRRCTGSALIESGLARKIGKFPSDGIILYHEAQEILKPTDLVLLEDPTIIAIDIPWTSLNSVIKYVSKKVRRPRLRRIPSSFIPVNPFYREKGPVYYADLSHFSTAEAIACACFILGFKQKGLQIINTLPYAERFVRRNQQTMNNYFPNI